MSARRAGSPLGPRRPPAGDGTRRSLRERRDPSRRRFARREFLRLSHRPAPVLRTLHVSRPSLRRGALPLALPVQRVFASGTGRSWAVRRRRLSPLLPAGVLHLLTLAWPAPENLGRFQRQGRGYGTGAVGAATRRTVVRQIVDDTIPTIGQTNIVDVNQQVIVQQQPQMEEVFLPAPRPGFLPTAINVLNGDMRWNPVTRQYEYVHAQ